MPPDQKGQNFNQENDFFNQYNNFNTQPVHQMDMESGYDYSYNNEFLDQQEVNSGDGAKD